MPKKKINNRLNKLFENIKSDGPPAQPKRAAKRPYQAARLNPDAVPADLVQPQAKDAVIASAPVSSLEKSDTAVLSLAFQPRENDWSTLRILDETTKSRVWSEDEQLLVRQVADQLSLALENAHLFHEQQKQAAELQDVSEISSAVSTILNQKELLDTFVYLTRQRFNLYHTHIFILEDDNRTLDVKACGWRDENLNGTQETRTIDINQPVSIVARAARTLQPVILNNVRENPTWLPNPYLPDVQSEMAIPIISQEKLLIGVLNIHADQLNAFDDNDSAIMTTLAAQIGAAIQNTRLFQETKERNEELAILNELSKELTKLLSLNEISELAYKYTGQLMNTETFFICLLDNDKQELSWPLFFEDGEKIEISPRTLGNGFSDYILRTNQTLFMPDRVSERMEELGFEKLLIGSSTPAKCWLGVPMSIGDRVLGAIVVQSVHHENLYTEHHRDLLLTIAQQTAVALENSRLYELSQVSEANFRNLVENAPEAIIVIDMATGLIADPNENAERLYGLNRQELVQMGIADLSPELQSDGRPSKEVVLEKLTIALEGSTPIFEWMHKNRQGKMLPCEIHLSRLPGHHPRVRATVIDITERKFNEVIRTATTAISDAALVAPDIASMLKIIHDSISTLVPAKNFYVSLYDKGADLLTFPYYVDEYDASWPPEKLGTGLTSYVIKTGKPLLVTPELNKEIIASPDFQRSGTESIDWIGVPLRSGQDLLGVMAIQTYSQDIRLTEKDRDTLNLLGSQVAIAIDRKRAQESITRSEAELRALFSAMNDVIIVIDRHGKYIRIAPTNPSRLFRPSEEMIGKTVKEILPSYIQEPMMSAIQEAITTGLPIQLEYWLDIGGQTYWFDASFSRLSEDQVFLVAKDITERKKAEETLRRRDEYLAASSEIGRKITATLDLETIFSRAVNLVAERFSLYHTAIYTIEETGFNAVLRDGTGVAGQELKKQKYKLPIKTDTLVGSVMSAGEAVINNNTAKDALYLLSHISRDAVSKPSHILPKTRSETGIPLRVGSRVTGVLDLQSELPDAFHPDDIAVLQTLADQIAIAIDNARSYELSQQAVREMREIDRLKSQFLANMSHELRTPLNSIIGFSRVIIKGIDGPVTELQQQDLTAIYNSGQHLLALINDILDLAKIEAGKMELAFDEVNMNDVINSVLATVTGLIKDKPVTIKKNIVPDMPTVRADAIRIRQVLINLFSNASKFTDEGTITVEASVKAGENSRPEIIVSVTDTGPGIAPEDQAKLFQAFSQVDDSPTRKTGGTGLGLSISQNLIQMHGGRIGVDSVVGKGSTFYFTLPVYRGNPLPNELQSSMGGKTILAIDDDPQVIRLYERYLQPQGYQVIAVTEPAKAKERAIQLKPFAITLDIMMPGIDGWQVLSELKSSPETRNIPVVICSIIEDHEKGFSLGAADYLSKPILEEDLLSALEGLNKDNLIDEILVIDDNSNDLKLIGNMLKNQGRYKPNLVEGGVNGWNAITKKTPQAVILDLFMPVMDGFTILENMRANTRLRDIPVIILTAGDLTAEQKHQLAEFGPRLIAKNALNEKDLIASIERALQRAAK